MIHFLSLVIQTSQLCRTVCICVCDCLSPVEILMSKLFTLRSRLTDNNVSHCATHNTEPQHKHKHWQIAHSQKQLTEHYSIRYECEGMSRQYVQCVIMHVLVCITDTNSLVELEIEQLVVSFHVCRKCIWVHVCGKWGRYSVMDEHSHDLCQFY